MHTCFVNCNSFLNNLNYKEQQVHRLSFIISFSKW